MISGRLIRVQITIGWIASSRLSAQRGELVVDAGRDRGCTVRVTSPSRSSWRSVRVSIRWLMPSMRRLQLGEALRAVAEQLDDEQRPLVGESVEQVADLAGRGLLDRVGRLVPARVPRCRRCAVFHISPW